MENLLETLFEVFGWIRIVLSPTFLGAFIGVIIYNSNPNTTNFTFATLLIIVGSIVGVIWATRVWRKHGTMRFLSRIDASPDLDNPADENEK